MAKFLVIAVVAGLFTLIRNYDALGDTAQKWRKYKNKAVHSLPGAAEPEETRMQCEMDCRSFCFRTPYSTACSFDPALETCSLWKTRLVTLIETAGAKSIVECMN